MAKYQGPAPLARVESTNERLTGRAGLALFVRYVRGVGIYGLLDEQFGTLRRSRKGLPIWNLFMQLFCFFFDGVSRHISHFDQLARDEGYAATLENRPEDMASSHQMKRFLRRFGWLTGGLFRGVLNRLFVWRLKLASPRVVELGIDTMVLDNDEAEQRHGVKPTYKKKKGFQPLQMTWGRLIVDAVFRSGHRHSNHGNTVSNMIRRMVPMIRQASPETALIVIRFDSGFFDEEIITTCEELKVEWILSGKMYATVKEQAQQAPPASWKRFKGKRHHWEYHAFQWGCDSWSKKYRTFYTRPLDDEKGQGLLDFARPDNVLLTNLEHGAPALQNCTPSERRHWIRPAAIIASHHGRGADELPHRALKDFGFEQLPFKRFGPNQAMYYGMLLSFFLFETFKEDTLRDVVPVASYAQTVRRKLVDVAAKIVRKGGQLVLRLNAVVLKALDFQRLWRRSLCPPPIPLNS